ncbi:hypothetical protein COLO4_05644 [Corchorus olitorius]|uniref:Uncharacterized protein n=1 Tax=Corchorus olitorius TaxID=93759 RepID=A0A1R3KQ91_9ROSI|nr:hypothetical protein COLO4_05644 [Corchorus olitorius]
MEEEAVAGSSSEKADKRQYAAHGWPVAVKGDCLDLQENAPTAS